MSTRDLINAIAAGDAIEIENAFNSVMAEKVSARIDDMRIDVAQNLFAEQSEEIEEEVELNLEDYSLEEIEEFMMSEDFEQLDEISKNTLTSYVDKANKDISSKMADEKRTRNTASNVRDSAHRKYMSGDSEGEKSRQKLGNALINKANKVNKQISNRQQNVAKAQNKIADKIVNKQD